MLRSKIRSRKLDFPFATINIVLLLLFFFIVTGSVVGRHELGVEPPLTQQLPPERLPRPLLLIDGEGALFLDDRPVSRAEIAGLLGTRAHAVGQPEVLNVIADREFSGESFLEIVDSVRGAGIPVRIITLDADARR